MASHRDCLYVSESFRFRCIRYLPTINIVTRANMQSPEAPMASSKIHSSTASMLGRRSELPMYGDFPPIRVGIGYGASSTVDLPRAPSRRKGYLQGGSGQCSTGKCAATIKGENPASIRMRSAGGAGELGCRCGRPSEALADRAGDDLPGQDKFVDAVADIPLVSNLASDPVNDQLV